MSPGATASSRAPRLPTLKPPRPCRPDEARVATCAEELSKWLQENAPLLTAGEASSRINGSILVGVRESKVVVPEFEPRLRLLLSRSQLFFLTRRPSITNRFGVRSRLWLWCGVVWCGVVWCGVVVSIRVYVGQL